MRNVLLPLLLLLLLTVASAVCAQRASRFMAKLSDGTFVHGDLLTDWHATDALPRLDDRPLLDAANPMRWLVDRNLHPGDRPRAFVEMFSGDRLPGFTTAFENVRAGSVEQHFACWTVRPSVDLRPPRPLPEANIRVQSRYVRRIVWRSRLGDRYQPGTAILRGGGTLAFRTARFSRDSVLLLLEDGMRRLGFQELDELHLPAQDFWSRCFDELGTLAPDGQSRLLQLETTDGLLATASMLRFAAYSSGDSKFSDRWVHGIQPAWSRDVLWVPCERVWMRRMWSPTEQPLSRIGWDSDTTWQGQAWQPRVNRSVQGGLLRSGGQLFGWGIGVHAPQRLTFPLPPLPVRFSCCVGLDSLAGSGGCVQTRIWAGSSTRLYESPLLVGSSHCESIAALPVPEQDLASRRLVLEVDAAHENRPAGADPFHIRDMTDWLEPSLRFEPLALEKLAAQHASAQVAAWAGWTHALPEDANWRSLLRETALGPGEFLQAVSLDKTPLSLTRRVQLAPDDAWLLVAASQDRAQRERPVLAIYADGQRIHEQEVPFSDKWRYQVDPIMVPIREYCRGAPRDIVFELRLQSGEQPAPVCWQGISVQKRLPMIRELFDERGRWPAVEPGIPPAELSDADAHSGQRSVVCASTISYRLNLKPPLAIRESPSWGEFRFLRFAFRAPGGGQFTLRLEHPDEVDRPARYAAGDRKPDDQTTRRIWERKLEDKWTVVTRDLYADFGDLDIDRLVITPTDGDGLRIDQVVAARMSNNLSLADVPDESPPPLLDDELAESQSLFQSASQARVRIDPGDGQTGWGTIVSPEGHVLTAGHLVRGPGRQVRVTMPDGAVVDATTQGVCRDLDLGTLQLSGDDPWEHAHTDSTRELQRRSWYFVLNADPTPADEPPMFADSVRMRMAKGVTGWSDWTPQGPACGAPLLNRNGHIVGVAVSRNRFGGMIFVPTRDIFACLDQMKKGEVWGRWLPDTTPELGFSIAADPLGCLVRDTPDNSPAKTGDFVQSVNGLPVHNPADVCEALAEKSPGDQIDIVLLRGQDPHPIRLRLQPRASDDSGA